MVAAKRIEPAVLRHRVDARGAGLERIAGDLPGRLASVVGQLGVEVQRIGQRDAAIDEDRVALDRRLHVHLFVGVADIAGERRVVTQVHAVGATGRHATIQRVAAAAAAAATRAIEAGDAAPLAHRGPAIGRMAVGVGVGAEPAVARPDAFLLDVFGSEADRGAVVGPAAHHVVLRAVAIALAVLAPVEAGADAFDVAAGDDVDHAGHRIGPVDGRCAILEHFHAFDGGGGQGGNVLQAAGGHAHALAVDQHEGALRAQPAHVHEAAAGRLAC